MPSTLESGAGRRARLAGAAWMLAGASSIGIVDGIAKYLAPTFNGVQVVWGYVGGVVDCSPRRYFSEG